MDAMSCSVGNVANNISVSRLMSGLVWPSFAIYDSVGIDTLPEVPLLLAMLSSNWNTVVALFGSEICKSMCSSANVITKIADNVMPNELTITLAINSN